MPNGFMDYMMPLIGMEEGLGPGDFVFDLDPATPEKGLPTTTQYLANVYCGQTAGCMKTPLGTAVDVGPGHIGLDGVPAPAKGALQPPPPLFGPCLLCPCLLWPRSSISATAS